MKAPTVTLGLPVFNGEAYLDEALSTALEQTYDDFELVVCDNVSTDDSPRIAARWAERDSRVRLSPAAAHTGAAENFNRAFGEARGRYFKWIAHDDRLAPTYLERCVAALDEEPRRVLAHTRMEEIDARGTVTRELDANSEGGGMTGIDHESAVRRFSAAISLGHGCFDVFGLIRRDALAETHLIGPYLGSDRVLLAELALRGPFARVPEVLFQSREHPGRSIRIERDEDRAAWFAPRTNGAPLRPHWRRVHEMRSAVARAPLSWGDRLACRRAILRWTMTHGGALARELLGRSARAATAGASDGARKSA